MNNSENIIAVVLCGGESKRMGQDKGLIPIDNITWSEHMAKKLTANGLPAVISINSSQRDSYLNIFPVDSLIEDKADVKGPLRGLLSAHEKFPEKDILLLGCDLIDMDAATLKALINIYITEDSYEYYTYMESDFAETLCSIYTSKALKQVADKVRLHQLEKFSLHGLLDSGKTKRIPVKDRSSFRNYNQL